MAELLYEYVLLSKGLYKKNCAHPPLTYSHSEDS